MVSRFNLSSCIAAAIVAVVVSSAASAADLRPQMVTKAAPMEAAYNWSGFYTGVHIGYGKGDARYSDPVGTPGWSLRNDIDGVIGGGQIGYNFLAGRWLFGVEGEFSGSGIAGTSTDVGAFAGDRYRTSVNWLAMATGRVGYAFGSNLLYVKGGGAWADTDYEYMPISFGIFTTGTGSSVRSGWTVGGGWEYGFARNWSAKVEYNYVDFGTKTVLLTPAVAGFNATIDQQLHVFKIGVNYRWNQAPVVARY